MKPMHELMKEFTETNQYQTPGGGEFTNTEVVEEDQNVIEDEGE
jgi:hypothetical protein